MMINSKCSEHYTYRWLYLFTEDSHPSTGAPIVSAVSAMPMGISCDPNSRTHLHYTMM